MEFLQLQIIYVLYHWLWEDILYQYFPRNTNPIYADLLVSWMWTWFYMNEQYYPIVAKASASLDCSDIVKPPSYTNQIKETKK